MFELIVPPLDEVEGIVLDMMPTIQVDAEPEVVRRAVALAEGLVALLVCAKRNVATEAVVENMLRGMTITCEEDK